MQSNNNLLKKPTREEMLKNAEAILFDLTMELTLAGNMEDVELIVSKCHSDVFATRIKERGNTTDLRRVPHGPIPDQPIHITIKHRPWK